MITHINMICIIHYLIICPSVSNNAQRDLVGVFLGFVFIVFATGGEDCHCRPAAQGDCCSHENLFHWDI